jgi:nitric oxide dioxygenase
MNINFNDMIEYPKEGILSKEILKNSSADVTLFCMAAGEEMSEHTSTRSGVVHVLEGEGIFYLDGKEIVMRKGEFIFLKKDVVHSLSSKEATSFVLILFDEK